MNLLMLLHDVFTIHTHLQIRFTVDQRNVQKLDKKMQSKNSHTSVMITMALRIMDKIR